MKAGQLLATLNPRPLKGLKNLAFGAGTWRVTAPSNVSTRGSHASTALCFQALPARPSWSRVEGLGVKG